MSKKSRSSNDKIAINTVTQLRNNPFAGMDLSSVVAKDVEEKAPEVIKPSDPEVILSPADQLLLEAFGRKGIEIAEVDSKEISRKKLFMRIEKKKRAGHVATTLRGFTSDDAEYMMQLVATIRKKLGVGGVLNGDILELQGNQCARLPEIMYDLGYQVVEG